MDHKEESAGGTREPASAVASGEDHDLVTALKANDQQAYSHVIAKYGGRLLALSRRMLRDEQEAKDNVQETLIQLLRSIGQFEGRSSFWTWLRRIAVNEALQHIRARKVATTSLDDIAPHYDEFGLRVEPGLSSSSKWPQRRELEIIVREAINQLPAVHRLVLLLRDVEQLSTAETAALLDLTVGAVKTRLHRARAALKRLLAPVVSSLDAPAEPRMTRRIRGFFARTLPGGLRCKEFEELISSYLDGELDRRQQVAFDMHLRRCPDCSRYLKAYQHTIELGRAFCEPTEGPIPADVPPDLADAVLSALQITAAMRPSE